MAKPPKSSTVLFLLLSDSGTFSVLNAEERERDREGGGGFGVASSLFLLQRAGFEAENERWVWLIWWWQFSRRF